MNAHNLTTKRREMERSWESWEYQFRDLLDKLDYKHRKMISEMKVLGVPKSMIAEYLPKQFDRIAHEVMEENERRLADDKSRKPIRKREGLTQTVPGTL